MNYHLYEAESDFQQVLGQGVRISSLMPIGFTQILPNRFSTTLSEQCTSYWQLPRPQDGTDRRAHPYQRTTDRTAARTTNRTDKSGSDEGA